ncbi:MAG: Uma2 family endonuclease [Armatimonadetes bacterium]|nr:Uma2 family endonuclease [Armatimonadota bacterium]
MTHAATEPRWTDAEYLAFERASDVRHEYLDGIVYGMSGGSVAHALLTAQLTAEVGLRLRGKPCRPYSADLRVHNAETGAYTYPDLTIVCGEPRVLDEQRDTLLNPTVVVEVLSPSTEAYDRSRKFAHYRRIPSLRDYILVSQEAPIIEVFSRREGDTWLYTPYEGLDASAEVPSIGCTVPLADIYAGVSFEPPAGPDAAAKERA